MNLMNPEKGIESSSKSLAFSNGVVKPVFIFSLLQKRYFSLMVIATIFACNKTAPPPITHQLSTSVSTVKSADVSSVIDPSGATITTRFIPPEDYQRIPASDQSFAHYLRQLPLKPSGELVHYFNGNTKNKNGVYTAVIDLPIGKKDLHQCADAVMRLKADYHFQQKEYDKIKFNFTNGFPVAYSEWRKGKRMIVEGNKTYWNNGQKPSTTYSDYWNYLELIFTYAGTASLSKEMKSINLSEMEIGDVLIQGGHPGHAVIVVDMAQNKNTSEKIYLLAQSYMPAQELQILQNPNRADLSPWYKLNVDNQVVTPEWSFTFKDLKRFQ